MLFARRTASIAELAGCGYGALARPSKPTRHCELRRESNNGQRFAWYAFALCPPGTPAAHHWHLPKLFPWSLA